MIVTGRTAGGEGVAEPETVFLRNLVGEVGKARCAFISRDDEIRIIAIVAHELTRRHHIMAATILATFGNDIVGQIEEATDQDFVTLDTLGHQLIPRGRRALQDKAAL